MPERAMFKGVINLIIKKDDKVLLFFRNDGFFNYLAGLFIYPFRDLYMPLFLTEEIEAYIIPDIPTKMIGERRGLWKRQFTRTLLQKNSKSLILTVLHSWIFVNRMPDEY